MKINKFYVIGLVAIIAIILIAIFAIPKEQSVIVRIGNLPVTQGLPVYLAIDKNYFADAGIKIELVNIEAPNLIIDALLQNKIDLTAPTAATGITGIAEYKNPGKLKVYVITGSTIDNPMESLLVPIDSNIKSIEELKGKKLGILAGTIQWKTITKHLLAQHGLDMDKDVIIVELAPSIQVQAFASKQIDALLTLEPIPTILKQKGLAKNLTNHTMQDLISDPFYGGVGLITTKFANENPELTKKVIAIINTTIKEIENNPEESRKYLLKYTALDKDLIKIVPLATFVTYDEITDKDKQDVQKFLDIFTQYKVVDGKINFDSFLLK